MAHSTRLESIVADDGGRFSAWCALPKSRGPGVMLLQEIFGVGEFIKAKAAALAELGYVVLCPDVFWRVEPGFAVTHDEAGLAEAFGVSSRFAELDSAVTRGDLLVALSHLRRLPEVDGRAGVMGYCLGGRLAYEVAVAGDPDVCISYYGSGIASQLDNATEITCPIILHFGGADPYIPRDQIDRIEAAFSSREGVEFVLQPQAGHAFENSFAPAFSTPDAASHSWPHTVEFLDRYLGVTR